MLHAIGLILRYSPLIILGIRAIETFVQPGTPGEQKRELAIRFISESLEALGVAVDERVHTILSQAITLLVTMLNAFGVLRGSRGEDSDAIVLASDDIMAAREDILDNESEFDRLDALVRPR